MSKFERRLSACFVLFAISVLFGCTRPVPSPQPPPPPPPTPTTAIFHIAVENEKTNERIGGARIDVQHCVSRADLCQGIDDARTRQEDGYTGELILQYGEWAYEVHADGFHPFFGVLPFLEGSDTVRDGVVVKLRPIRPPPVRRTGVVRMEGTSLADDQGYWFADAVTLFPAISLVHNYPDQATKWCDQLRKYGVQAARVLAVVGGGSVPVGGTHVDPWKHHVSDPRSGDFAERLARTTDYLYDECGVRTAWTLFGGVDNAPSFADQVRVAQIWLDVMRPRLSKVAWVEVSNESWQTGFGGKEDRLRELARILRANLPSNFPISISATPEFDVVAELKAMYGGLGGAANMHTPHLSRDVWKADGPWRPVRQPWGWAEGMPSDGPRAAIDNEPIGPGSSVAVERNASRLVMTWVVAKVARMTGRVFHTDAGVWACHIANEFAGGHDDGLRGRFCNLDEEPGAAAALDAQQKLREHLPSDMHTWHRTRHGFHDHPFAQAFLPVGVQIWPDEGGHGVVRPYCSINGPRFVCAMVGIRSHVDLSWAGAMEATIYSAASGEPIDRIEAHQRSKTLRQEFDTDQVVVGTFR